MNQASELACAREWCSDCLQHASMYSYEPNTHRQRGEETKGENDTYCERWHTQIAQSYKQSMATVYYYYYVKWNRSLMEPAKRGWQNFFPVPEELFVCTETFQ